MVREVLELQGPPPLAVFVTLDIARARLGGKMSNQRVIARKPV
jgi:hypothetical protein